MMSISPKVDDKKVSNCCQPEKSPMQTVTLSHHKHRCFKPEKLKPPRNFVVPHFIKARMATEEIVNKQLPENQVNKDDSLVSRRLVVEIGAGKGKHAYHYAEENPEVDVIAIERTSNKFATFKSLIASDLDLNSKKYADTESNDSVSVTVNNLLAVHADAIPYCVYALPPKSVSEFYLLYPNPEPKNLNQQWLNMPFFEFLLSRLVNQGKVILASNIKPYIDNAYEQSLMVWQLNTEKSMVPIDSSRTHFEAKYLARGETCWELQLTKPREYHTRFDDWLSSLLMDNTLSSQLQKWGD